TGGSPRGRPAVADSPPAEPGGAWHGAVVVESDETVRTVLAPAVRRALDDSDGVFVVVAPGTGRLLGDVLGGDAARAAWADAADHYRRLGTAYSSFWSLVSETHAAGRRLHVFAEPDVASGVDDATPVDRAVAYLDYEAMCGATFAGFGCPVTCVW